MEDLCAYCKRPDDECDCNLCDNCHRHEDECIGPCYECDECMDECTCDFWND